MFTVYAPTSAGERSKTRDTDAENLQIEGHDDTTPKVGIKRLYSNRESRQIEGHNYTNYNEPGDHQPTQERHSDKRHRNEDWPLPSSPNSPASARPPLRHRNAPNTPSTRRRAVSQQRPSRFQEGSMNDRISAIPPTPYLDGEDDLSEYDPIEPSRGRKIARPRKFTKRNDSVAGASVASQSENGSGRHSIFRFGKSIAASFNPSNWKIWSKGQHAHEDEETAQMQVLRERQSKAERIYRELKESGQFQDSAIVFPNSSSQLHGDLKPKHDSGVEFGGENESASKSNNRASRGMSMDEKRKGRIFLEPPDLSGSTHGGSPGSYISGSRAHSNNSSPNKSFHFKKPSLSNLKKSLASISSTNISEQGQVRRIPSRKDLHKQQKLVKRVSDLEGKLQAARKQLSDALGEPLPSDVSQVSLSSQGSHVLEESMPPLPPLHQTPKARVVRKPFVPGALASLPSERLLAGYVQDNDEEDEEETGIGMAVTVNHRQQSDEKPKRPASMIGNTEPPAWLGKPLRRSGSSSFKDYPMQSVESKFEATTPTVKPSLKPSKSDVATTITSLSEPSTRDCDPNDRDYVQGDEEPDDEEDDLEGEVVEEEKETTPKPRRSPPSKKRKTRFEGVADDGGLYKPDETEESDLESLVKKPSPRRKGANSTSPPRSNEIQGRKITLKHPRKLQKILPSEINDLTVTGPPKRAPPAPPVNGPPNQAPPAPPSDTQSQTSRTSSKHPARTSSLKATVKSPPPNRLTKTKPPPMPTNRQQSASPPPSSAFTGVGPELEYKKPSHQRQAAISQPNFGGQLRTFADEGEDLEYSAHPLEDAGVPPMPKMPQSVRLASGEIIETQAQTKTQTQPPSSSTSASSIPNGNARHGKLNGSTVSNFKNSNASKIAKSSANGKLVKEKRESMRLGKKKESLNAAVAALASGEEGKQPMEKKSFEWPDDVF